MCQPNNGPYVTVIQVHITQLYMVEVNIINFEKDLGIKNTHIHKQEIKIKNRTEREVLTFEVVKLQ